jgi:ribosomal protein S10
MTSCCTLGENDELIWSSSEPLLHVPAPDDKLNKYLDPLEHEAIHNPPRYSLHSDPYCFNVHLQRRFFHLSVLKPQTLYTIRVTHANNINVMAACGAIEDEALKLGIPLKSIAYLPTRIQKFTLLRSAHVDKYARDQLEIRRHKRVLTIEANTLRKEYRVLILGERANGVASNRITMTKRIPANTPIVTLTFQKHRFQKPLEYE